ncbi:type II toxin-antitoxin system VapC family toxin [Moraxella nasibovis]|uniref:type II toxin-antitoxin system VapC family toxin n=1 Tax=Moraxella nasibovis TaxID=2904120 RepID=UPI00240FD310|nr:type II toxin-antitoxin system VapC family toxin [Moraxella nasibovis]WFF39065.1 type II toxin-antitoxin system VapC family toxin [Moraxella nasibovis]
MVIKMSAGYLLDTHTLLWYYTEPARLSKKAAQILTDDDNEIFVSSASVWEMATKHRKGKLGKAEKVLANFETLIKDCDFKHLPVTWRHAKLSGEYALKHADPFDRMLAAQAQLENLVLVSCDDELTAFPIDIIW